MSLWLLDWKFGTVPRHYSGVTDHAKVLNPAQLGRIQAALSDLNLQYPQVYGAVLFTSNREADNLREYAFWLLNRCRFAPPEAVLEKNYNILLLIDPERMGACLMVGYGLEGFLSESRIQQVLEKGRSALGQKQWTKGCIRILHEMQEQLTHVWRQERRTAPKLGTNSDTNRDRSTAPEELATGSAEY